MGWNASVSVTLPPEPALGRASSRRFAGGRRVGRLAALLYLLFFLLPLALHAAWWLSREHPASWSVADWRSAGLLPPAEAKPDALVHVYAARAGRWKGVFAHHTWLVLKERGAARYERFDKVGWGRPVRRDGWAPDARWYGNAPELVAAVEGPAAEALIPRLRAAIAEYPYAEPGDYRVWPGPNSNSFVAHVLVAAPELAAALPPTALGKDWRPGVFAGLSPSGFGLQVSLWGLFGVTLGWAEGLEVNVLGLVAGFDVRRPALKLPGFGRIGLALDARADSVAQPDRKPALPSPHESQGREPG